MLNPNNVCLTLLGSARCALATMMGKRTCIFTLWNGTIFYPLAQPPSSPICQFGRRLPRPIANDSEDIFGGPIGFLFGQWLLCALSCEITSCLM